MDTLSPAKRAFVLHWGQMGDSWGINRSMAQIHALLYLSERPLNAEDIAETLSLARSNISTSLRELQGWGLIRPIHLPNDRRDHYESLSDVWEMFLRVLDERRKREIIPTIELLTDCAKQASQSRDDFTRQRIDAMLDFLKVSDAWYLNMRALPREALLSFFKMGAKVRKMLGLSG